MRLTESNVFAYACLRPLVEVASFPAPHIQYLPSGNGCLFGAGTLALGDGARRQCRVTKVGEEDGFDPVVEVFKANYRGLLTHSPSCLWASVVYGWGEIRPLQKIVEKHTQWCIMAPASLDLLLSPSSASERFRFFDKLSQPLLLFSGSL